MAISGSYERCETGARMKSLHEFLVHPENFPLTLDTDQNLITFVRMSPETYRDSVFLDFRARHLGVEQTLRLHDLQVAGASIPQSALSVTYILHPAFCCSTLLARYFELLPSCLVLKEPLLLTQVALASMKSDTQWEELLDVATRLLTRAFPSTTSVVIKAHEPCNILGRKLLGISQNSQIIFLVIPRRHFVLSVLKSSERRSWIRSRVGAALLTYSRHGLRNRIRSCDLTDAQAATYLWNVDDCFRRQLAAMADASRFFELESNRLVDHPRESLLDIMKFRKESLDNERLEWMVAHPLMQRYSKNMSRSYDAEKRRHELESLENRFGAELDAAEQWSEQHQTEEVPLR